MKRAIIAAAAMLCALATAPAQTPNTPADEAAFRATDALLLKYDADGDGIITAEECADAAVFARYDKRKDHKITADEIFTVEGGTLNPVTACRLGVLIPMYKDFESIRQFDFDHDGALDAWELRALFFAIADDDKDHLITLKESHKLPAPPGVAMKENWFDREFHALDTRNRGKLGWREFRVPASWMKVFDKDGDGRVSFDEFVQQEIQRIGGYLTGYAELAAFFATHEKTTRSTFPGDNTLFHRLDENHDSIVTVQEFDRAVRRLRTTLSLAADFIIRFDLDGDGRVSRAEFIGTDTMFARLDRNGDGFITAKDR